MKGEINMEFVQPIRDKKQIEAMKKILRSSNIRDYCLFIMGINSGLRVSDLLALSIEDVVDEKDKVRDRISVREKKTGKSKDFPIGSNSKKAILEYLGVRAKYDRSEPLFKSRKGGRLSRVQAWQVLHDAARAVGLNEPIGTHSMRKSFGFHAFQMGVDITRIQQLLNHSAPSVTLAYIGITQDELDDVYLSLDL